MKLAIGCDHAGVRLRDALAARLREAGHELLDVGTAVGVSVDYPDRAHEAVRALVDGRVDRVILVCGTGQGMAMAANKVPGVRAGVVSDPFSAAMIAEHNDAKVLCLGERVVGEGLAWACVEAWLAASFAGGRHARRVDGIERGLG